MLYFEVFEQIWGGSPAVTAIKDGLETEDVLSANHEASSIAENRNCNIMEVSHGGMEEDGGNSTDEEDVGTFGDMPCSASSLSSISKEKTVTIERRKTLNAKLAHYKQEKLKRKILANVLLANIIGEEITIKQRIG